MRGITHSMLDKTGVQLRENMYGALCFNFFSMCYRPFWKIMLSSGKTILSYYSSSVKFSLASLGTKGVAACGQSQRMSGS